MQLNCENNIYVTCDTCWSIYFTTTGSLCHEQHVYHSRPLTSNNIFQKPDNSWLVISQFVRVANRYLEALYNGLPFTLTHFFLNILEFVRQTSIIATVCLRFYRQSDVTLLKEFQQCLNSRYLASTSFSIYTLCHSTNCTTGWVHVNVGE